MRKLAFLLAVTFLFESCFSYKRVEINPSTMVVGKKYKIESNNKLSKVVLKSVSDSSIVVVKHGYDLQIPLSEITTLKKRKFSVVKTIVAFPLAIISLLLIKILADPDVGGDASILSW